MVRYYPKIYPPSTLSPPHGYSSIKTGYRLLRSWMARNAHLRDDRQRMRYTCRRKDSTHRVYDGLRAGLTAIGLSPHQHQRCCSLPHGL